MMGRELRRSSAAYSDPAQPFLCLILMFHSKLNSQSLINQSQQSYSKHLSYMDVASLFSICA